MDAGTAYEVGFMRALGKPILGYSNAGSNHAARARLFRMSSPLPYDSDRDDLEIEDFDMAENLMIAVAVHESGGGIAVNEIGGQDRMADLTGFRQCLVMLHKQLS